MLCGETAPTRKQAVRMVVGVVCEGSLGAKIATTSPSGGLGAAGASPETQVNRAVREGNKACKS